MRKTLNPLTLIGGVVGFGVTLAVLGLYLSPPKVQTIPLIQNELGVSHVLETWMSSSPDSWLVVTKWNGKYHLILSTNKATAEGEGSTLLESFSKAVVGLEGKSNNVPRK